MDTNNTPEKCYSTVPLGKFRVLTHLGHVHAWGMWVALAWQGLGYPHLPRHGPLKVEPRGWGGVCEYQESEYVGGDARYCAQAAHIPMTVAHLGPKPSPCLALAPTVWLGSPTTTWNL
jgi:hypothetical protein